jgi:hypothetical protein
MILECFIGGVTLVTLSSLRFSRWILEREDRLDGITVSKSFEEKRNLLMDLRSKSRAIYLNESGQTSTKAYERMLKIDDDISNLDDEEVRRAVGK